MRVHLYALLTTIMIFGLLTVGDVFGVELGKQPPVVVKTVPAAGAKEVDPSLGEIIVTFSKDMMEGSWSWVQISPENFPQIEGQPRYLEDKRTCVLPVRLERGKTYIIWLNTQKFANFKDTEGRPAEPYLLMFETAK